jgi:gliding motility-associated-like protein
MVISGDPITGCKDSAYVKIIVQGSFYVPNTFTPNYDGLNDVFKPKATNVYDYSMDIYDRWGNHLFTTTDIEYGWNGFYKGQLCQEDVYVYKIEYSQKHTKNRALVSGHINLVR